MVIRHMVLAMAVALSLARSAAGADTGAVLAELEERDAWGEARLRDGTVRPLRVLFLSADSVRVQEVIGALHQRPATYSLKEIDSVRILGQHRIPRNPAPYQPRRSMPLALCLEVAVPGGGFFYLGQARQGWSLLAFSAAAGATAALTGRDGLAGWLPLFVWTRLASLVQVRDEVAAHNAALRVDSAPPAPPTPGAAASILELRVSF